MSHEQVVIPEKKASEDLMMKSMKTLMISAVVCGAMALPLSGVATPDFDRAKDLGLSKGQIAKILTVRAIVCAKAKSVGKGDKMQAQLCDYLSSYYKTYGQMPEPR